MSYRDDIAALEARVTSLHREASEKVDELERAQQLVAEARRRVRGHVLDAELATPCTASWDDMTGSDRVRHCSHCNKNVYNFSELDRDQINRLIMINEGKLCARFFVRADGTIVTKDCNLDIRVRPLRRAAEIGIAAAAAAALAAAGGAFVDGHRAPPSQNVIEASMGTISFDENRRLLPEDSCDDETSCGRQPIAMPLPQQFSGRVDFPSWHPATNPSWYPATSQEVQDSVNFNKREAKRQQAATSGPSFNVPEDIEPK